MWLAGLEKPDFRTLCLFRTNNKEALEKIFTEVIIVAKTMGMATLGLVALDGSKVRANSGIDTFKKLREWKIAAIAHNLLKITAAIMRKERILPALG